ncbi:hypothetical protein PYV55_09390 [Extensimonas sp. H3M7-6]|nr:hypothetical protein [Extensimonas sp. H3M7-6]MDF1482265.1 hypothetical protein [Extensimonas sp. H3M7-6]
MHTPRLNVLLIWPIRKSDLFMSFRERVKSEAAEFLQRQLSHSGCGFQIALIDFLDSSSEYHDKHCFASLLGAQRLS